jgi:uncharacterized repeat protein (TIGR02543 family)
VYEFNPGSTVTGVITPTAPLKEGYTFTGFSQSVPTVINESIVLTAQYEINTYTITFDSDGGSEVSAITDEFNKTVVRPSDPTKVGYTFNGWDKVIPSVMPAEDITIKALWDLTDYTITYNLNGGINPLSQPTTFTIVSNAITLLEPTKAGYTFSGWFDQETGGVKVETIPTGSSSNQTLYARFTADAYTLTYNLDGGVNGLNPASYTVEDQLITLLAATKEGYTFNGWYLESSYTTLVTQINPADTKNSTLYARFTINTYTITFDTDGGSLIPSITQEFNSAITAPANPSKEGYTFTGWDKAVPVTMPAENSTLIANFEAISYTITFDSDGGSLVSAITQGFDTVVTKPSDPTLEGFTFVGWFTDKESLITPFVFDTMPLDGASLYAKWSRDTYTITVISSISGVSNTYDYLYEADLTNFKLEDQNDLFFRGFYTDAALTERFTLTEMPATNLTLYPLFSPIVNFDLSGIKWIEEAVKIYNGTDYTVTIDETTLPLGLIVLEYKNHINKNVGTYTIEVVFGFDPLTHFEPTLTHTYTITKATYDLSSIVWSIANEVTYTGSAFTATIQSGLDAGLTPNYTNQTYTNAGTYKTSVTFNYDQDNYETPILGDFNWTILKATYDLSSIIWSMEDTVTYNGQTFSPTIVSGLPEGVSVTYGDVTSATQAGTYVTKVNFTYDTDNYNVVELSYEWTIEKATFDMSQVSWTYDGPFKENEDIQGVTLRNLPVGVTATYTNNMFRLPGTYIATVTYDYDKENYNTLVEPTLTWIIIPTYVYNFIVDGEIIFSQRAEVSDPVDVPEVSKEGYLFKGFDKVVPEEFGNANQDFTATFILLDNVDDTHENIDVLNAVDLSAFANTDINIDTVILKTTSETLDESLRKSYKQVFDSIQAPQFFDFKKLGFTEVKLVISIITNGQTTTVTQLKEGVLVTVYLNDELKGLEGFEIVDLNSKERIQSTYNPETHTMTFVMTQLGAYGLTYQMFDIIPVLVIIAIILFLIILYLLLKRRKKEDEEEIKPVVKPSAVQTQKEPAVLEAVLKVDAVVIPGVTSRPTYIGGANVDSGYYLEVTKDFDSTNRIIDVEDELLPHVLTNGNAFIKISQAEVALLSLKGLSAFGFLKKTPGSKGEKGYYAEVDLVNIFTGRTIILVEKLPPTSKKGHRWVRVQTRVIK